MCVCVCPEECGASLHTVTAGDVYGSYLGESERRLRDAFDAARRDAEGGRTAVVFLDEVRDTHTHTHTHHTTFQFPALLEEWP